MILLKSIKTTLIALLLFSLTPATTHTGSAARIGKGVYNGIATFGGILILRNLYNNKDWQKNLAIDYPTTARICTLIAALKATHSGLTGIYENTFGYSDTDEDLDEDQFTCLEE